MSLDAMDSAITKLAEELAVKVDLRQSNSESELVTWIQEARTGYDGIIINPAAYTHTSVAIRDAIGPMSRESRSGKFPAWVRPAISLHSVGCTTI